MASSNTELFQLRSHQTAVALIVPAHLRVDIDSLRRIHDRAFSKWVPHINVIYPFVDPASLAAATSVLRDVLKSKQPFALNTDEVGVFQNGKTAVVHLRPSSDVVLQICELRQYLVDALGCDNQTGTKDGTFRPHLTVGRAGPNQSSINRLVDQVGKLDRISWDAISLMVLRREESGKMECVEELSIGGHGVTEEDERDHSGDIWRSCFAFDEELGWSKATQMAGPCPPHNPLRCHIMTYNIMAEVRAPKFETRLPHIIEAIESATQPCDVRILCLQEVDHEALPRILNNSHFQKNFPFATHSLESLLPSHRNLVTLASTPFKSQRLPFPERHKSALIANFDTLKLNVINTHLSSSLDNEAIRAKLGQMRLVADCVRQSEPDYANVAAGDFNLTTSTRTIETALSKGMITPAIAREAEDIIDYTFWADAFMANSSALSHCDVDYDGEEGATFDRLTNPLAALTDSPIENRPERYDRVLFQKVAFVRVIRFEIVGYPDIHGRCGSDHYAVSTVLDIHHPSSRTQEDSTTESSSSFIRIVTDETDLESFVLPFLPTEVDEQRRKDALSLLQSTLRSNQRTSNIMLAPLGSYLLGTYFADSDVDVLAIGDVLPNEFSEYATSQLRHLSRTGSGSFQGIQLVNSLVSIIEVSILGIRFDVQYCQARELLSRLQSNSPIDLSDLVFNTDLISSLNPSSIRPLNTYRDTAYILKTVPCFENFQIAHRFLSLYLKKRGLYSARFGYLGGIHLSLMLNRLVKCMYSNVTAEPFSPATIVRTFLSNYATFDWQNENVVDPSTVDRDIQRLPRDAILIQAIHAPTARRNVASSCTRLTGKTLTEEFRQAAERLDAEDWAWCLRSKEATLQDFLQSFGAFIRVEIQVWSLHEIGNGGIRELLGGLESKFPKLLVSLARIDDLDARVWPERLCDREDVNITDFEEAGLKGFYLVGVSSSNSVPDAEQRKLFSGKVINAMREFEFFVTSSKDLQGQNSFIKMELLPRKSIIITDVVSDCRDWADSETNQPMIETSTIHDKSADIPMKFYIQSSKSPLRPAQDIISRLHWDELFVANDFLIGYEDRFVGVKEAELTKWKSEQTDEEFIPMHRIVWIRQKDQAGGEKVWDRKQKLDLIFGSGHSTGGLRGINK